MLWNKEFKKEFQKVLKIKRTNTLTNIPSALNRNCGAEYVHKEQKQPRDWQGLIGEFNAVKAADLVGKKQVSFDGDADRQIYFYQDEKSNLKILDGDK